MEQKTMNQKFVKMCLLGLIAVVAVIICGYGGSALWAESKLLSVLAYIGIPVVLYFAIARAIKINKE